MDGHGDGGGEVHRRVHVGGLDADPAGRRQQVADVALGQEAALGQDRRPVADQLDLGQQMTREEDRRSLRHQLAEQVADLVDPLGVEPVGRLVEDD